ncbi:MAG TPA: hypothetical protein PLL33_05215 [Paracoccus sp. (in: a-proteobacteria)]|nr:hypothetical protein [Paracoccus sp. (in: a-proteobacteria)]
MTGKHLTEDQIQSRIASDPDAPEASDDQLAHGWQASDSFASSG